ncbi:UDP-glucose 4-epimerase [Candidatus Falkowbacteria bacterium HGW-Falkowbacteria-1]|jgi:UDP-glucose 4-epimerase|uniref:UDP-glucose 4-epimerase n=1 Tax=Candidatus Falkowbacteria bacterium HGW-Falkowbacteria-1 TaxID=2013768 RepID=A0A2N2EAK2_9BACT|nr:MAG: UDP-glucose 4-epimerase [Candidatus Falkowbacteria bacterium HGW-Falkowbacteria-1]
MFKILVTGGAGFIGSNLVNKLLDLGHEVVVIDDLSSGKKEYLNPVAKFYHIDINDKKVNDIFKAESFDYVCHLAAQIDVRKSVENMTFDNQVNVLGGINILKNCHNFNVKKIIFSSSGGAAYGFPDKIPTKEHHPTYPVSPYGINKICFEKYLNYYYKVFGQKYIALRLANVYGPRQYKGGEAGVIANFTSNAIAQKKSFIYGDGLQTRDYIYVDDVVEAFVLSIQSDFIGELNVGTGIEKNLLEVVEAIEASLGSKLEIEYQEAKLGEERRSALDASLAKEKLNWEAKIDLNEGIKRTIEWASNNNFPS